MAAHQAPPSLGFSRQEHWSGLPFPSPMHESDKWKWSRSVVSDSSRPHGLQPTRLLRPWDFPGKSTGVGCHCLLHDYVRETVKSEIREFKFEPTSVSVPARLLQSCSTLWDPMDYRPPGSSVHGILQARMQSGWPCPPPGDLPDSETEPAPLKSLALAARFFTNMATWETPNLLLLLTNSNMGRSFQVSKSWFPSF